MIASISQGRRLKHKQGSASPGLGLGVQALLGQAVPVLSQVPGSGPHFHLRTGGNNQQRHAGVPTVGEPESTFAVLTLA